MTDNRGDSVSSTTAELIRYGTLLTVVDASGISHPARALTGVTPGRSGFPIVWVCFCETEECQEDAGLPWPADAVEIRP